MPIDDNPGLTSSDLVLQLLDENPLAREAMERTADIVLAEEVHIHYTQDNKSRASAVVQRKNLLDACSSLDSLHGFLKQQLGIPPSEGIEVSWSDGAEPDGKHVQLTAKLNNPFHLAFIVGRAACWFVSVKQ